MKQNFITNINTVSKIINNSTSNKTNITSKFVHILNSFLHDPLTYDAISLLFPLLINL